MIESKFKTVKNPFGVGFARYLEKHHDIKSGYALAQKLKISTRTACQFFEDDYRGPSYLLLEKLSSAFGYTPSEFLDVIEVNYAKEKSKKKHK